MQKEFTHLDKAGNPTMVDVAHKSITDRSATAQTIMILDEEILNRLEGDDIHTKKGPVFQTAILAGIMAAKKTSDLIPLCHPLGLDNCSVDISINNERQVLIQCTAKVSGKTGVEMEALTGASIAALTIYDMCKGFSHNIEIRETKLVEKKGGKSDFSKA